MASAAQRRIKSISYAKYGYMFIAPFFLVYCFFQIWPLIQTFILSFQGNGADAGTFVGFVVGGRTPRRNGVAACQRGTGACELEC